MYEQKYIYFFKGKLIVYLLICFMLFEDVRCHISTAAAATTAQTEEQNTVVYKW